MRVKKRKRLRTGYTDAHIDQLRNGYDFLGEAFGDLEYMPNRERESELEAMRRAWNDPEICEAVERGCSPLHRSWAWWQFSAVEPRDNSRPEWLQLFDLGLLDEVTAREQAKEDSHPYSFRRPISWWRFLAPEPRDENVTELAQLVRLHVLTPHEQSILDGDEDTMRGQHGNDRSTWLSHLSRDERRLLGLPDDLRVQNAIAS